MLGHEFFFQSGKVFFLWVIVDLFFVGPTWRGNYGGPCPTGWYGGRWNGKRGQHF
jgi:hypothetical protein